MSRLGAEVVTKGADTPQKFAEMLYARCVNLDRSKAEKLTGRNLNMIWTSMSCIPSINQDLPSSSYSEFDQILSNLRAGSKKPPTQPSPSTNQTMKEIPPSNLEICFNFWVVVDEHSRLAYSYMGRAYGLHGTEEEKLRILHALSGSDFFTVPKRKLPDRFSCETGEGMKKGVAPPEIAHDTESGFWSELIETLSKDIPPQVRFALGRTMRTPVPVPDYPLCVITTLLESANGVLFPQVQPFEVYLEEIESREVADEPRKNGAPH